MRKLILALILIASSALAACNTSAPQMQTMQETNSKPEQVKSVKLTDAQVKAALARAHIATPANKLVNEASRYCFEIGEKPRAKLYADCVNAKVIQLEDPTVKVVQVKPTQALAQPTAQVPVQAPCKTRTQHSPNNLWMRPADIVARPDRNQERNFSMIASTRTQLNGQPST